METPTRGLDELLKRFSRTEDASEQYDLAHKIHLLSPKDFKDMQALNRAIKHYCERYPDVSRALDPFGAMCRSLPPDPEGKIAAYLRREAACATLDATRKRWALEFKERKIPNLGNKGDDPAKAVARATARMQRMGRISSDNMTGRKSLSSYPPPLKKR